MENNENIKKLLLNFLTAGLILKDIDKIKDCFSDQILGIGLGEQGFVASLDDVEEVLKQGIRDDDTAVYTVELGRVEIMMLAENLAMLCAEVKTHSLQPESGRRGTSQFQQTLVVKIYQGEWKICGLHASTPTVTEEGIDFYPLNFAEKTLSNLRKKIGEEVYLKEEQYRKAVLSDSIAFYIINFTKNIFEECHLENDICVYVNYGEPYEETVKTKTFEYVYGADRKLFMDNLSLKNISKSFEADAKEISCEYRMRCPEGHFIWTKTIIRLITDVVTGEKKGIMYVKNIDEEKREEEIIRQKADYDSMTKVLNKGAMIRNTDNLLHVKRPEGVFLMMDVDNFKYVNDVYGHPLGDRVLILVAETLKKHFIKDGLIGRLGGDEFAVFLQGAGLDTQLKERICSFLADIRSLSVDEYQDLHITVSLGGAELMSAKFEEYYKQADKALYMAKNKGKNTAEYLELNG